MAKKKKNKISGSKHSASNERFYTSSNRSLTDKEKEAFAKQVFYENRKIQKKSCSSSGSFDYFDFDSIRLKRRIDTSVKFLDEIKNRFQDICPNIDGLFSLEENWFELNSYTGPAYDIFGTAFKLSLGAAIWILDQLQAADALNDAYQFFPSDYNLVEEAFLPDVWDPCHSNEVLSFMTYMIEHRNFDCIVNKKDVSASDKNDNRFYIDLPTALCQQHQQVDSRIRYESVLNLISDDVKVQATQVFIDKFWDWLDRYYRSISVLLKDSKEMYTDYNRILKSFISEVSDCLHTSLEKHSFIDRRKEDIESFVSEVCNIGLPNLTDSLNSNPCIPFNNSQFDLNGNNPLLASSDSRDTSNASKLINYQFVKDAAQVKINRFTSDVYNFAFFSVDTITKDYGEDIALIWKDFEIQEPYSFCFAFLHLLDEPSDIPWLYGPCKGLISYAIASLPWAATISRKKDGPFVDEESFSAVEEPENIDCNKQLFNIKDWYHLDYLYSSDSPNLQRRYNLSHVIYDATGCIIPRNISNCSSELDLLDKYGIHDPNDLSVLIPCISILKNAHDQNFILNDIEDDFGDDDEDFEEEIFAQSEHIKSLQTKISELQNEVSHLKKASYEARRELSESNKRYDLLLQKEAYDKQELANLREVVFQQNQTSIEENIPEVSVSFPYLTQKRHVVFGGHDSWSREIKPKLPEVRFIDRNMQPNSELIRRADVVWIQTNAISHSNYYKIIDEARTHKIPVRYFSFASAIKCAEQVVFDDLNKD